MAASAGGKGQALDEAARPAARDMVGGRILPQGAGDSRDPCRHPLLSLLPLPAYLACVLAIGLIACWAAGEAEHIFQEKDSRRIVIDEVVGFFITMTALPITSPYLIGGFCLFRFFDILKPPPIRLIERKVPGGYGVVLDDVLAGIYAQISLRIIAALL